MAFFHQSSGERRGIWVLCLVLLLAVGVVGLMPRSAEKGTTSAYSQQGKSTPTGNKYYAQGERKVETFPFDPNTADSTTLLRLGLTPAMVRGIYKYRSMGYTYSDAADFSHLHGLTQEMWQRLAPCIRIDKRFQRITPLPYTSKKNTSAPETKETSTSVPITRDTMAHPMKLRAGEKIELNSSDTSALKKIPGIGSYYARRIVYYRQQLGGFSSLSQLEEVEGIPEGIEQYLTLNTDGIKKIDVNHATKNQLLRHPYLRVYRASDIWSYRHNHGSLKGPDDLRNMPSFSEQDIQRLLPYLEFK